MKHIKIISVILLLLLTSLPLNVSAENTARACESFLAEDGGIIAVSYRGERDKFPENSLQGIRKAISDGADMVYINVKVTVDGQPILCADEDLTRLTDCEDTTPVTEMTLEQVQSYNRRDGVGGKTADVNSYHINSLSEVLFAVENSTMLMIDFDFADFDVVYETVENCHCLQTAFLVCRCDTDEYTAKLGSLEKTPYTVLYRKTNIVFTAWNFVKTAEQTDKSCIWLASSNTYGVVWKNWVMKHKSTKRGVVCTAEPGLCGQRYDTEAYWNDLVSRGYSVIITDDISGLIAFRDNSAAAKQNLADKVEALDESFTLPEFDSYEYIDYKKAYTDAYSEAQTLLSKQAVGEQEANECIYSLNTAVRNINTNYADLENGVAGVTFSIPRLIIVLLSVVAVVAAQLYIFKKRKKG